MPRTAIQKAVGCLSTYTGALAQAVEPVTAVLYKHIVYTNSFEHVSESPDCVRAIIDRMIEWAAKFKVEVSLLMSSWWGTVMQVPASLIEAYIPRKWSEQDLGADVAYGQRRSTNVQQGQVQMYSDLCDTIAGLPASASYRGLLWPRRHFRASSMASR